eukprot:GHVH01010640.1.p1 GENE.GHVH01010640.1~~GHVH01010640.1.p1  ORF type:complete len:497 (-),score=79.19 GHVH01010640.1:39-1529(-)
MKSSDVDPDKLLEEDRRGGTLLLLNTPGGADIHKKKASTKRRVQLSMGLDAFAWEVGSQFLGVRCIPSGAHLLYWNCVTETGGSELEPEEDDDTPTTDEFMGDTNIDANFGPARLQANRIVDSSNGTERDTGMRTSRFIWIDCPKKETTSDKAVGHVVVLRWDDELETFLDVDDDESGRYADSVRSQTFHAMLAPYPSSDASRLSGMRGPVVKACQSWPELANCITKLTLSRVEPLGNGFIAHKAQEYDPKRPKPVGVKGDDKAVDDDIESFTERLHTGLLGPSGEGGGILFSDIPNPRGNQKSSDLSECYLDRTHVLQSMWDTLRESRIHHRKKLRNPPPLPQETRGCSLEQFEWLGELQIAFLSFLIGLNFDSFAQWRNLLELVVQSPRAMTRHVPFYKAFLRCLYTQLDACPSDFFIDELSRNNFVAKCLVSIYDGLGEELALEEGNILIHYFSYIEELLRRNFKTSIEELRDEIQEEEGPAIVDLDEEFISF